jgi:hypothetical protein
MNKVQLKQLEADLRRAADHVRANSELKSRMYSILVHRRHEAAIISER